MPLLSKLLIRRLGPIGVAFIVYDVWRQLPAKQRQQLLEQGLTHGVRAARSLTKKAATQIRKRRG